MNFFVSGKVGNEANVQAVMDVLIAKGHYITCDWTKIPHLKPYDENKDLCRKAAIEEYHGVAQADMVIIMPRREGAGLFVELGIALGRKIPVRIIINEPSHSMFYYHPLVKMVKSIEKILSEIEGK